MDWSVAKKVVGLCSFLLVEDARRGSLSQTLFITPPLTTHHLPATQDTKRPKHTRKAYSQYPHTTHALNAHTKASTTHSPKSSIKSSLKISLQTSFAPLRQSSLFAASISSSTSTRPVTLFAPKRKSKDLRKEKDKKTKKKLGSRHNSASVSSRASLNDAPLYLLNVNLGSPWKP